MELKEVGGKILLVIVVFILLIKVFKDYLLDMFDIRGIILWVEEVLWVLIVFVIWIDFVKFFMRKVVFKVIFLEYFYYKFFL